jgi:two-component system chemotaxis response regulator CheB
MDLTRTARPTKIRTPETTASRTPGGSVPNRDIVVAGASAGGVEALRTVVASLPGDWPGVLLVVLHMAPETPSVLGTLLERAGVLPVSVPWDAEPLLPGHVYVARPDFHLMVSDGQVLSVRGPRENRRRPGVDPLFRSAALAHGPRVVGVVLTGSLDDGTAGLLAIKSRGGVGIAQDPAEALFPSMPRSAIGAGGVDHVLPVAEIPALLVRLASEPAASTDDASALLRKEVAIDLGRKEDMATMSTPSTFTCPECHGVLSEVDDPGMVRFRCQVGHAYSGETLVAEQDQAHEAALWAALRALEESAHLSDRMAATFERRSQRGLARRIGERGASARRHAQELRKVLTAVEGTKLAETVDG